MAKDKNVSLANTTFGKLPAAQPKANDDAAARNADDQRKAAEAPKPTTHGLPSAPANVKPAEAPAQKPLTQAELNHAGKFAMDNKLDVRTIEQAPKPIAEAKPEPDGPMSLNDVNAILADEYPGFVPNTARGDAAGLTFPIPGGGSIIVERAKIKKCANMEELRAYIDSVK